MKNRSQLRQPLFGTMSTSHLQDSLATYTISRRIRVLALIHAVDRVSNGHYRASIDNTLRTNWLSHVLNVIQ